MLTHLRIEAEGRSYGEVMASLDQITELVTGRSWPSTTYFAGAPGSSAGAALSWSVSTPDGATISGAPLRHAAVPETWRIPDEGGEVIERIAKPRSYNRGGGDEVFYRGRRLLVFEPEPADWDVLREERLFESETEGPWIPAGASLLERSLAKLREHQHEEDPERERLEAEIERALYGHRVVTKRPAKPTADELQEFSKLVMNPAVQEASYRIVQEPAPGYDVQMQLAVTAGGNAQSMPTGSFGETLGEAVAGAVATVEAFLSAVARGQGGTGFASDDGVFPGHYDRP